MTNQDFSTLKQKFEGATLEEKIDLYCQTQGLTLAQYKQLLRLFPVEHISKLEDALG